MSLFEWGVVILGLWAVFVTLVGSTFLAVTFAVDKALMNGQPDPVGNALRAMVTLVVGAVAGCIELVVLRWMLYPCSAG